MKGLKNLIFLFFFQLSVSSYYRCFYVDTVDESGKICSTVFCSDDKISHMYENSKFLLTEIEDILFNLRNEKASHQMENAYNKQLDYETTFPPNNNYEDNTYFLDLHNTRNDYLDDFSDLHSDQQMEFEMREPVPFINMNNLEETEGDEEYNSNVVNDINNNLTSSSEEEIDRLLSKIRKLEGGDINEETTNKKSYMKRYFR